MNEKPDTRGPDTNSLGNTMMVSYSRYLSLKATGRVTGGDPLATGSDPAVYTDENGIKWALITSAPNRHDRRVIQASPRNRQERRAAKAQARKKPK